MHARAIREGATKEVEARHEEGYDALPYWHKYSFPMGALGQAEHKLVRLAATCREVPLEELLEDDTYATLMDNAIGLMNYAMFFAATLRLLKHEEDAS
jgi:hypothetical protein